MAFDDLFAIEARISEAYEEMAPLMTKTMADLLEEVGELQEMLGSP